VNVSYLLELERAFERRSLHLRLMDLRAQHRDKRRGQAGDDCLITALCLCVPVLRLCRSVVMRECSGQEAFSQISARST
jgi:hypothetical protein